MWGRRTSTKLFGGEDGERVPIDGRLPVAMSTPPLRGALPRVAAEFARARRYERPITIAVFTVAPGHTGLLLPPVGADAAVREREGKGAFVSALAVVARSAVREIDIVSCDATSEWCVVVMPESGQEEGERAVARMQRLCAERLGGPVLAGLALFPRDGWTFLDLVDSAKRASSVSRASSMNVG
jgi:hypothetical protein